MLEWVGFWDKFDVDMREGGEIGRCGCGFLFGRIDGGFIEIWYVKEVEWDWGRG